VRWNSAAFALCILSGCNVSPEPFDRAKCELKINTVLSASYQQEAWRLGSTVYPTIIFNVRSGDKDLLHTYMKHNRYFSAATDPDDTTTRNLRYYLPDAPDDVRKKMAEPGLLSQTACEASYLTSVKLEEVLISSGEDVAFRVDLN